jgi:hypothetical protein
MDNSIDEILSYLADETSRLESTEKAKTTSTTTMATVDGPDQTSAKKKKGTKKAASTVKRKSEESSGDPAFAAAVKRFQTNQDNKNTLTKAVDVFNQVGKNKEALALQDYIERDFDEAIEIWKSTMPPDSSIEPTNTLPVGVPWNWDMGKDVDQAVDIMESAITLHHSTSDPSGKATTTVSSEPKTKKPKWKPVPEENDTSDIVEPWILCPQAPAPAMPIPWRPMEDAPTLLLAGCLFLCTNCFAELHDVQNCMQLPGGRVILTHSMCAHCAQINTEMKHILYNN